MNMQEMVREFHETFGAPVAETPRLIPADRAELRIALIREELDELIVAEAQGNLVEIADALGDLLYVVLGAGVEHGISLLPVVKEIHASNMSKADENGNPILREDGKILKGVNFFDPRLDIILEEQGW